MTFQSAQKAASSALQCPRFLFPFLNQRSSVLPTERPLKWFQLLDFPPVITTDC